MVEYFEGQQRVRVGSGLLAGRRALPGVRVFPETPKRRAKPGGRPKARPYLGSGILPGVNGTFAASNSFSNFFKSVSISVRNRGSHCSNSASAMAY